MRTASIQLAAALTLAAAVASAQDIMTADQFFKQVSARYATIQDYEAVVAIKTAKQSMEGTVLYKAPTLMRVDFTQPAGQVFVYNGESLVVYVPEFRAILNQQVSGTTGASAATGEGLRMLGRNYSIAYETGPTPTVLPGGGEGDLVVRLVLSRLTVAEGFRTIILSIDPTTLLIRRMEGTTLAGDLMTYDFSDVKLDRGIAATRFLYDSPASANVYNDFIFSSGQ